AATAVMAITGAAPSRVQAPVPGRVSISSRTISARLVKASQASPAAPIRPASSASSPSWPMRRYAFTSASAAAGAGGSSITIIAVPFDCEKKVRRPGQGENPADAVAKPAPSPLVGEGYRSLAAERLSEGWMGGKRSEGVREAHASHPHPSIPSPQGGGEAPVSGRELQQLDRLRVHHLPADPPRRVEVDERLVGEGIAKDLRLLPLGDQISGLEIAECDRQRIRRDVGHVLGLHHRIAEQRVGLPRHQPRLPDER